MFFLEVLIFYRISSSPYYSQDIYTKETPTTYSGHMCNLRVKILWPFKSITALENLATFLIETNRVDSSFLEPPRDRVTRTARMFLEGVLN
jgi:hypothetical protein